MPGAVTVEETTATMEERDAKEIDIGNKVQETEQDQDQKRAKEMTIPEMKTSMTNVGYMSKRAIGQTAAVIVLLVDGLPILNEIALRIKGRNKPT